MLTILLQHSLNLFFLAGFVFVSTGLGLLMLKKGRVPLADLGEMIFFSLGLGFGIIGYTVFFLGVVQLLHPVALTLILVFFTILSFFGWFNSLPLPGRPGFLRKPDSRIEQLAVLFLLLGLLGSYILTLTPDPGKDALIYHLAAPKLFLKHQGFTFISGNIFSNYPLLNEMLFLVGLFLRGEVLAKGMHFIGLLGILIGIGQFSSPRVLQNGFPFLSLLIFLTIPSVFITSHLAYNDLFITYYSLAAVLAFIQWVDRRRNPWLVLCGVFSGLAVASKYTALLLPLLGCLGVLWASSHFRENPKQIRWSLFLYLASVGLVGAPFYIKNWIMTGNPVYPFLYHWFGGREWDPEQARLYDFFVWSLGQGRGWLDYLLLPWNISLRAKLGSPEFDGLVGPVFLLTLPFWLGIRRIELSTKIIFIFCLFTFLFWASSAQQIRYLIPIFPFLSLLTGIILASYDQRKVLGIILILLIAGSLAFNGFTIIRHFGTTKPFGVLIGTEDRDSFLKRRFPSYGIFNYINTNLPGNSKLFLIYMKNWGFFLDRDFYSDSMFETFTIQKILSSSGAPKEIHGIVRANGFTHLLCDLNYLYGDLSPFSLEEKGKFIDFQKEYLAVERRDGPYFLFRLK